MDPMQPSIIDIKAMESLASPVMALNQVSSPVNYQTHPRNYTTLGIMPMGSLASPLIAFDQVSCSIRDHIHARHHTALGISSMESLARRLLKVCLYIIHNLCTRVFTSASPGKYRRFLTLNRANIL